MPRAIIGSLLVCTVAVRSRFRRHGRARSILAPEGRSRSDRCGDLCGVAYGRRRFVDRLPAPVVLDDRQARCDPRFELDDGRADHGTTPRFLLDGEGRSAARRGRRRVHPRFRTPHVTTMITGGIVAVMAALVPISSARAVGEYRDIVRVRDRLDRRDRSATARDPISRDRSRCPSRRSCRSCRQGLRCI